MVRHVLNKFSFDVKWKFFAALTVLYILLFGFLLGMLSHELKRNMIDGEKAIIQNPTDQQR